MDRRSTDPDAIRLQIDSTFDILEKMDFRGECWANDWGISISNRNYIQDSCCRGAFLLKNILSNQEKVTMFGISCATDLTNIYMDTKAVLCGSSGILSRNGIPKPACYAFEFLGSLGDELIFQSEDCAITAKTDRDIEIICYNYRSPDSFYSFADCYGFDGLGDNYGIISTDAETDTVNEYHKSDDYYECLKRVKDWNEKGYVYKDAALTELDGTTLMKNGVTFSFIALGNYGIEDVQKKNSGYEVVAKKVLSIPVGSNVCQTWGIGVPVTSDEPEAAVSFIDLMYTNADIMNLFAWGIEGEDYEVNEEGEAVQIDGAAYTGFPFLWGNASLSYPSEGQGGDFYERAKAEDDNAEMSKYMGFVPNTESFANELTAVNTVLTKYKANLESGSTPDLEGDYQKFLDELDSAGVNDVIAGYQEQLDSWIG